MHWFSVGFITALFTPLWLTVTPIVLHRDIADYVLARDHRNPAPREVDLKHLPREVLHTLALIRRGGPFPYRRDGSVFRNFERHLPIKERGYYREYTVRTPGARNRGARRIVAGRGGEYYYTSDHYRTFKRIRE